MFHGIFQSDSLFILVFSPVIEMSIISYFQALINIWQKLLIGHFAQNPTRELSAPNRLLRWEHALRSELL